jgi:hypothetical protein
MSGTPARLEFTIAQENKTVRVHFLSSSPSFRVNGVRALEHRPQSLDMMVSGLPMVVQRVGCVRTDGLAAETVLKFSLDGGLAYEVTGVDRAIVAEAKTEDELAVLRKRKEAIEERIMELEEQSMGVQYC